MSVPFVGRADELVTIRALIGRGRTEHAAAAVLIIGEPGSGKTRLLREALGGLDAGRTIHVSGFEPTESTPFAAVGDLVRRLAGVADHGPRLEALVFGTDGRGGQVLPVFEAAHRAMTAFGSMIVSIDDLQWVDAQSVAMLHYLVRAAESARQPLAVVAAARPSAAGVTFAKGIDAALPEARRVAIELGGLGRDAGLAMARSIDPQLDDAAAEELWQRASGSPFWLETLTRDRGAASIVNLVADRLRSLSPDAARLMGALAILARPTTSEEVAALLEWPEARLDHAIRELVARGLASEGSGRIRLAHDLIREGAASVVPSTTARRLHSRIAEVMERSGGDDLTMLAEALDHRTAAGLPTAEIAARIVTSPLRRLIGVDLLRRLSGIAEAVPITEAGQAELDAGIGRLAGDLAEGDLAIRHWSRVAAGADGPELRLRAELEAARCALHARLGPAMMLEASRRADVVRKHLARARSLPLDEVSAIELDTIEAELGLWIDHDTAAGSRAAARAILRGRELTTMAGGVDKLPPSTRSILLAALGPGVDAALQEERPDDVVELSDLALEVARSLGDEARLVALLRTAFPYRSLGMNREAATRYREAWEISHRLLLPMSMIESGLGLARASRALGQLAEARAVALETGEIEARTLPWRRWDTSQVMIHTIDLDLGEPTALERLREDAVRADPHFALATHQLVAEWLARRDGARRRVEVEQALGAAWAASAIARCPRCERNLEVVGAELLARIGRVDEARAALASWETEYSGPPYPARTFWAARTKAAIEAAAGDLEAGASLLALAAAFDAAGRVEEAIWTRIDLGRVLRSAGDRRSAVTAFTEAATEAERIGAVSLSRIATAALRDLGVRAWRRPGRRPGARADSLSRLSARELEVARLIADGSSNREIAETLVISSKTVERHVTNILGKLDARNRTEVATRIGAGTGTGISR